MSHGAQNMDEEITGINVVPLVDIVLVLLIIFMVTANFMAKPAIDMELPSAETGESKERNQFSLLLGEDGSVSIGEKTVDEANIAEEFQHIFNNYKTEKRANAQAGGSHISDNTATVLARNELTMVIQADKNVSHGRIIYFIDSARKVGILKYAFNVDPAAPKTVPLTRNFTDRKSTRQRQTCSFWLNDGASRLAQLARNLTLRQAIRHRHRSSFWLNDPVLPVAALAKQLNTGPPSKLSARIGG